MIVVVVFAEMDVVAIANNHAQINEKIISDS